MNINAKIRQKNAHIRKILKTVTEKLCTPAFAIAKTEPIMRPSDYTGGPTTKHFVPEIFVFSTMLPC